MNHRRKSDFSPGCGLERNDNHDSKARPYHCTGAVRPDSDCGGGKSAGLSGAIAGGVDTFLSKNKAKTWDSKLAKLTKWVALLFVVLTLVLSLI